MLTICACGAYEIEQSTAAYRKGEKPMCHPETCSKVTHHNAAHMRRADWPFRHHRTMGEIMRDEGAFDVVHANAGG